MNRRVQPLRHRMGQIYTTTALIDESEVPQDLIEVQVVLDMVAQMDIMIHEGRVALGLHLRLVTEENKHEFY